MDGSATPDVRELRIFLESLICDLCRLRHASEDGIPPGSTQIHQEVRLSPGVFADIRVMPGELPPYFVEVALGHSRASVAESVRRKYGRRTPASEGASRVVIVADRALVAGDPPLERELAGLLAPGLRVETWDEAHLAGLIRDTFGFDLQCFSEAQLLDLRQAIDRAKAAHAFGASVALDPLHSTLLWHFAYWRLAERREAGCVDPRDFLPPLRYSKVVVVMADLCAYSSYVRDTHDDRVIRESLTAFASKTRYRFINDGGMLYQFVGDSVVGFFGIPTSSAHDVSRALACARGLVDIGAAIAEQWQRQIDQAQPAAGVHVAMALGEVQVLSLRPFSRTHMGAVADAMNLCARLNAVSGPGEIVASNLLYQALPDAERRAFTELDPVEAKNIGRVKAWRLAS
jgi:class 3 adenylate cyclase